MLQMKYNVIVRTHSLDGQSYTAYGIHYEDMVVEDISLNRQAVEDLAALFNLHELSPVHFHDAIDDFLADFENSAMA